MSEDPHQGTDLRHRIAEVVWDESCAEADERSQILPYEACLSIADKVIEMFAVDA